MGEINKLSLLTTADIASYIRLDEVSDEDTNILNTFLGIVKKFISEYTGRTEEDLDNYQDMVIVALVLCQDMWDNRAYYVDKTNLNKVVQTILDMHSINLLPKESTND